MIFLNDFDDNTYMHSWAAYSFRHRLPDYANLFPPAQLMLLRGGILFVGLFAFVFSLFFAQLDYL